MLETFKGKYNGIPELEIRFYDGNFETFKTLYDEFSKKDTPEIECAVYIIDEINNNERDRREIYYKNGVVFQDKSIKKKRLHKNIIIPNDFMKYSVGLSLETPIKSVNTKANNVVRFRTRASFPITFNNLKWRLDLTAVKSGILKTLEKVLPSLRERICGNITKESFIDNINKNSAMFDSYEIELEYVDDPAKITEEDLSVATTILKILNPKYETTTSKQDAIFKIASYLYQNEQLNKFATAGFRDLVPQVKTLDKQLYSSLYPLEGYYLTEKTDGIRNIIMVNENIINIVNSNDILKIPIHPPQQLLIVDAEIYNNVFYVFDVIYHTSSPKIANAPFAERVKLIDDSVATLQKIAEYINKVNSTAYSFVSKTYDIITKENIKENATKRYTNTTIPIDGLIFVEPNNSYIDTTTYKWKSYEHNTIDFLAIKLPDNMKGVYPYIQEQNKTIYILFVSIIHHDRIKIGLGLIADYKKLIPHAESGKYPIQFSPSIDPIAYIYQADDPNLGGKIVELTRNDSNTNWVFVRTRDDRLGEKTYYGNAFSTAERTFLNFYDKFELSYLWNPNKGYFKERQRKNDSQFFSNKCKRIIIAILFKKYLNNAEKVIDFAVGRGGDLPRYRAIGVSQLLGIERDAAAATEFMMGKYRVLERKFGANDNLTECEAEYRRIQAIEYDKLIKKDVKSMTIHSIITDLTEPYCITSAKCGQFGFAPQSADGLVCNFAIHYMCDVQKNVKNLFSLALRQVKKGGYFIITTMNGEKVFDLLKRSKEGESWQCLDENNDVKYKIEKKYKSTEIAKVGQTIATLLPMSNEMMEEPLANITYLLHEAKAHGFECVESKSFADYREDLPVSNITDGLNADDWFYIGLYHIIVLKCISNKRF